MYTDHDVIILGSGCAGLTAAIYTGRAGLDTLVLESKMMGGEMVNRQTIENYPGFGHGAIGTELSQQMPSRRRPSARRLKTAKPSRSATRTSSRSSRPRMRA